MKYAIGIDIGGTNIKYALIDQDGKIYYESLAPTEAHTTRNKVLDNITNAGKEIIRLAMSRQLEIEGIGIGTPGLINNGMVLGGAENLPDWQNLPLKNLMERSLGYPVFIDNDANLMGLGEVRFGAARGTINAIFLTVGTGIGGAMVLNGQLYGGHDNRGGELGHIIIDLNGKVCGCGATGCLEAHASVPALIDDYKKLVKGKKISEDISVDGKYIVERYLENEDSAVQAMDRHFNYLAVGIAGLVNIFSPQKVIIGGGISEAGDFYVNNIFKLVKRIALKESFQFTVIESAQLGNKAGFLGAAALVFDKTV